MGTGRYLCKLYNYYDSRAYGYKRSGILFRLVGMVGNGVVFVETLWSLGAPLCLCDHTL
jgi:hypothetical protein